MSAPAPRGGRRPSARSGAPRTAAGNAYDRIRAVVARIPRGRVATYGQVAARAGYARAPRLAGYALHALPPGSPLPWHRVVGAGGRLSLARLSPDGALTQRLRLAAEGVSFDARGRVRLDLHGWTPGARTRPTVAARGGAAPAPGARARAPRPGGASARRG